MDMRNYLEHPNGKKTVINNFQLLPDGRLNPPAWHLSGETPVEIDDDMSAIIDFLIHVSEEMLIHLIMYCGRDRFTFAFKRLLTIRWTVISL